MTDVLRAFDAEIGNLERELEGDPRYVRLTQIRKMRADYLSLAGVQANPQADTPKIMTGRPKRRQRADPARQQLLEAVVEYLKDRKEPIKTADIFAYLDMFSIEVAGENPRNNLSAILHNSGLFKSFGRAGWMLPENAPEYERLRDSILSRGELPM